MRHDKPRRHLLRADLTNPNVHLPLVQEAVQFAQAMWQPIRIRALWPAVP